MNVEETLRSGLPVITRDVEGGPVLQSAIAAGRARRRVRRLGTGGAGLAAVAGIAFATAAVAHVGGPQTSGQPSPGTASHAVGAQVPSRLAPFQDFVATSDVDELMQRLVQQHLGSSVADSVSDVYPSDWTRNTPLPDRDAADATDWEAHYVLGPKEELTVVMGYPDPHESGAPVTCPLGSGQPAAGPGCEGRTLPDGRDALIQSSENIDRGTYTFLAGVRDEHGFTVNSYLSIRAASWEDASSQRSVTDDELLTVAADLQFSFPPPQQPPR
jgi:hypothetical protein